MRPWKFHRDSILAFDKTSRMYQYINNTETKLSEELRRTDKFIAQECKYQMCLWCSNIVRQKKCEDTKWDNQKKDRQFNGLKKKNKR